MKIKTKKQLIYIPEKIFEEYKDSENIFEILRHPLWNRYQSNEHLTRQ